MMQTFIIGRDISNNIVLNDVSVSRYHARLKLSDNGLVILEDMGSSNGTFVNGNRITEVSLKSGDIVKCANSFLDWQVYTNPYQSYQNYSTPESKTNDTGRNFNNSQLLDINTLIHEKEKTYLIIMQIISGLIWFLVLISIFASLFLLLPVILFPFLFLVVSLWLMDLYFKVIIYGDSVKVTSEQFPQVYKIAMNYSQKLGLKSMPDIFIYNGNGMMNALAIKFLSRKYVILMSDLVDLMLKRGKIEELSMIIGHELGHHGAKHTSFWKRLFIRPAKFVPLLGSAYSRSCELTADRIGCELTQNVIASQNALVALALGSESLANEINVDAFIQQENHIPEFMGFLYKIFSTQPRMTKRVIEIINYSKMKNY